jgi:RNA recognition motif-containing protein
VANQKFNKLYVSNLHATVTDESLKKLFDRFGPIDSVQVQKDQGRSKGFAFVTFKRPYDAKTAMHDMDGFELMGKLVSLF